MAPKKNTLSAGEIAEHIVQLEIKAEKHDSLKQGYTELFNSVKALRESQKYNFSEKTKKIVDSMIEKSKKDLLK